MPWEARVLVLVLSKGALCFLLMEMKMLLILLYLNVRSQAPMVINTVFSVRKPGYFAAWMMS